MRNSNIQPIDFGFLYGLLPGKEKVIPCDIDMVYEINKHFLIAEWKKPNEKVSAGQAFCLKALANQPKTVVLVVRGMSHQDEVNIQNIYRVTKEGPCELIGNGIEEFKQIILNWYNEIKG